MHSDPHKLELEALVARMTAADFGDGHPDEVRALEEHLAANPGMAELHGSLAALWEQLGELDQPEIDRPEPAPPPRWWESLPYHKIAAALIPCLMVMGLLFAVGDLGRNPKGSVPFELRTAAGERRVVSLPDGSAVTLSARSAIRIDLQPGERRLHLIEGEAIFDVEHDPSRPFVVAAGNGEVTAIGTTFNIRVADDGVVVTVIEGRVNVSAGLQQEGKRTKVAQLADAGEQIAYGSAPISVTAAATSSNVAGASDAASAARQSFISPARQVDAPRVSDWSRGVLRFSGEPLSQVVSEMNRHSLRQIEVHDAKLARTRIYGVLHIADEKGLISIVKDMGGYSDAELRQKISVQLPNDTGSADR